MWAAYAKRRGAAEIPNPAAADNGGPPTAQAVLPRAPLQPVATPKPARKRKNDQIATPAPSVAAPIEAGTDPLADADPTADVDVMAPEKGRLSPIVLQAILTRVAPTPPGHPTAAPPPPAEAPPAPPAAVPSVPDDLRALIASAVQDAVRTAFQEHQHSPGSLLGPSSTLGTTTEPGSFQEAWNRHRATAAAGATNLVAASIRAWSTKTWGTDVSAARQKFNDVAVAMYQAGRAPTTWDTRRSVMRAYEYFALTFHYDPFPATMNTLIAYAVWSAERISAASVLKYIGHIRATHAERGQPFPDNAEMPQLMQILSGFTKAQLASKAGDIRRLPMTFGVTTRVAYVKREAHALLAEEPSVYSLDSVLMAEAAYGLGLVGALRPSELAVRLTKTAGWSAPLTLSQYQDDRRQDHAILELAQRKNAQLGGPRCQVVIGATHHWFCARANMRRYLDERERLGEVLTPNSLLFPIRNPAGELRAMTYVDLTRALAKDCERAGFDPRAYTGHSFRIGAATTMAINGVPTYWIEDLGGWARGSKALNTYIHLNLAPAQQRANMSAYLARSFTAPTGIGGHAAFVPASAHDG